MRTSIDDAITLAILQRTSSNESALINLDSRDDDDDDDEKNSRGTALAVGKIDRFDGRGKERVISR